MGAKIFSTFLRVLFQRSRWSALFCLCAPRCRTTWILTGTHILCSGCASSWCAYFWRCDESHTSKNIKWCEKIEFYPRSRKRTQLVCKNTNILSLYLFCKTNPSYFLVYEGTNYNKNIVSYVGLSQNFTYWINFNKIYFPSTSGDDL